VDARTAGSEVTPLCLQSRFNRHAVPSTRHSGGRLRGHSFAAGVEVVWHNLARPARGTVAMDDLMDALQDACEW